MKSKKMAMAIFQVGEALCGLDISTVQEINKHDDFTAVPLAANYIAGVLNLRGKIVTIVELSKRLGLPSAAGKDRRNIIVTHGGETIGLRVDGIGDIIESDREKIESPPANVYGIHGKYIKGVLKTDRRLIGILDLPAVLD